MRIQHNIMAMNAYRNYTNNTSALSKNLEKLSSGYRINRAGDDAAGLAISEKMRAQITGLKTAQKNAKDGISLVQTAEGALTEVHDMLNRMVELANQSANGTYDDDVDRKNLQKEFDALRTEIDRIADSSNFNGKKLLNGDLAGGEDGTSVAVSNVAMVTSSDGSSASAATKTKVTVDLSGLTGAATAGGAGAFSSLTSAGATVASIGACVVSVGSGTALVSDLFTVTGTGTTGVFELVAKTGGSLGTTAISSLTDMTVGKATAVDGISAGAGAAASKSEYSLTFDFSKINGGEEFTIGDKTFKIVTDGVTAGLGSGVTAIDLTGLDLTVTGASVDGKGRVGAGQKIHAAISAAFGANFSVGAAPASGSSISGEYTLTFTATTAGATTAANLGEVRSASDGISGVYKAGKDAGKSGGVGYATVTYEVDIGGLAKGDRISIGGKTLEIVDDADVDGAAGKISVATAHDGAKLAAAFEAAGYAAGKLDFSETGKVTITDTEAGRTGRNWAKQSEAKVAVFKKAEDAPDTGNDTTTGLTLQIGEDSEDYNQLTLNISDMHVKALGIDDTAINISSQAEAQDAVAALKTAINSVSSTRGSLGATQNRLEHTINNLSVMQENIQDAESSIRDVDVADEMMAYTKNNILVQSAQAMLAQANQVPQGVLQLLQ